MAKTKALISCAVTAQLICVCGFAYAKNGFLMTRLSLDIRREVRSLSLEQHGIDLKTGHEKLEQEQDELKASY